MSCLATACGYKKVELISRVPLFAKCSKRDLQQIASTTSRTTRVLVITDQPFGSLLRNSPQIQAGIVEALAERLAPELL